MSETQTKPAVATAETAAAKPAPAGPAAKKRHFKLRVAGIVLGLFLVACAGFVVAYLNDYYPADSTALAALENGTADGVQVAYPKDDLVAFLPQGYSTENADNAPKGFIFYPGAKVQATAYAGLLRACAESGLVAVLVPMPFNFALLGTNKADGIQDLYPQVESWYIGGHSLGGVAASSYVSKHADSYDGLILLAAYSADKIPDTLKVLSIYGTEDGIRNLDNYQKNRGNLPANTVELLIEGGNHCQFGSYGLQQGDNEATISPEAQVHETVADIMAFVG
ncbi:MAG: alpha/beta hydrolase [Coriobacteriia bacterium]|nr:alpha/beta hydrolase [Coriobacteriia bacterium]